MRLAVGQKLVDSAGEAGLPPVLGEMALDELGVKAPDLLGWDIHVPHQEGTRR